MNEQYMKTQSDNSTLITECNDLREENTMTQDLVTLLKKKFKETLKIPIEDDQIEEALMKYPELVAPEQQMSR